MSPIGFIQSSTRNLIRHPLSHHIRLLIPSLWSFIFIFFPLSSLFFSSHHHNRFCPLFHSPSLFFYSHPHLLSPVSLSPLVFSLYSSSSLLFSLHVSFLNWMLLQSRKTREENEGKRRVYCRLSPSKMREETTWNDIFWLNPRRSPFSSNDRDRIEWIFAWWEQE